MLDDKSSRIAIRRAAMNLLARREQTQKELQQKLQQKFPQANSLIAETITQLTNESLQSDQRFAESFVKWRVAQGRGLIRIQIELADKGVSDELIRAAIAMANIDWQLQITDLYQRKFGDNLPNTLNEKAKIQRFFISRGFSYTQINALWKNLVESTTI